MEIRRLRVQAAASRRRSASSRAGELFKNVMFSSIFYPFKQKMPEIATIFSEKKLLFQMAASTSLKESARTAGGRGEDQF